MIEIALFSLTAFVLVLGLIPALHDLAVKIHLVDEPGGRKQHHGPVPLIGGLVIFPVFMAIALIAGVPLKNYWPLFAAIVVLLVTGALDDRIAICARVKFLMQFIAAFLIVVPGGVQVENMGNLLGVGELWMGAWSIPFSLFCTVLLINAINLMDGLDGLAGGKSFVVLFLFGLACWIEDALYALLPIAVLMGAILGFLYYNMRHPWREKANVFLGDAGSMSLGLVLSWYAIGLAQEPDPVLLPISVAWILALPVMDACGQFVRRAKEGNHPFTPDRGHFHHHFIEAGHTVGRSTAVILVFGLVLGGIGYGGVWLGVPTAILFGFWVLLLFFHVALSLKPQKFIACLERLAKKG